MKQNNRNEKISIGNDKHLSDIKSKSADELSELAESIINTVREPLVILDKDLRVVKANQSFFNYFKVSPGETIGAHIYDLGNRQWDIPKLKELLEKILPEKLSFDNYEVEHDFTGIGNRIMLLNARQIKRAFGRERVILLAIEDITERKHLEESLSETSRMTSEYLDILVNHAHFPIIIWDASFVITRFNKSFEKLSGYDISEVMGKQIDFLFPENKRESTLKLLQNSLHEEKFEIVEVDILRKDKEIRTVLWDSANVFDKDGRIIIATVAQDINERKRAENALKESEKIFNRFLEKSPYYVFFKDKDIRAIRLSSNYEQMLGKPLNSILGKTMDELFPSELAKRMIEVDKEILNRRETVFVEEEFNGRFFTTIKFPIIINDIPRYLAGFTIDITERKQIEEKLRESEEKYRAFFENSMDAILLTNPEGGETLSANPAACKLFGYNEEEFIKLGRANIVDTTTPQLSLMLSERAEKGKVVGDLTFIKKDGTRFSAEISSSIFKDHLGSERASMIIRDITERKQAEMKLRESEERFRRIFENAKIGLYRTTPSGKILMANNELVKMLGYPSFDALASRNIEKDAFGPSYPRKDFIEMIEKNGEVINFESAWVRLDGTVFFVSENAKAIRDSNNNILYFDGVVEDITERKQTEEKLQESEEKYKTIAQSTIEIIFILDKTGKLLFINKSVEGVLGYKVEEVIGKSFIKIVQKEDRIKIFKEIKNIFKSKESSNFVIQLYHKDGHLVDVETNSKLIKQKGKFVAQGSIRDITERKQSEEELQKSEERYRSVTQSANDAIITTDSKGIIIDWNKGAQEMFGYLETEISGEKLDIIIPKDDLTEHIKNKERSVQNREQSIVGKAVELQGLHKNGKEFPIELSLAEWEIPSGKFFTGIIRDITERKQAEEEITILAHSLRSINECVSITDLNDKILFVNKSFLKTYGYEKNELIGKPITIVRSNKNPMEYVKEILPATIRGEWKGELLNKRKDGSEFPIFLSTTIIYDKDGKPLGLIGVALDITEHKQMVDELYKLSSAVEQSPTSIIITDIKGNIEYANPKVTEITGYQLSELVGKNPRIFATGEKPAYDYKILWDKISSGNVWHGEFHNKKKNGELYWESASISAIKNDIGEIIHYLAVKEDITEKKKINDELISSRDKAEEMNRLKSNFLANMSHELRTPLVGIVGFAEIIRQDVVSPEIKMMADSICKSGNRLSETLNLILDLTRFETEKKDISFQKVDLVNKTNEIITLFRETADKKGLSLISVFNPESILIDFDERAYNSILNNLLNNAIKFSIEGSITISVSQIDHSVEIKVTDTGIGISQEDCLSIFDEFRQASEGYSRNFEGSGLGLSITKKLVEKYGGTITVESEVGKGSTFKVILPVTSVAEKVKELIGIRNSDINKTSGIKISKTACLIS